MGAMSDETQDSGPVQRDWFAIVAIIFEIAILLTAAVGLYRLVKYY